MRIVWGLDRAPQRLPVPRPGPERGAGALGSLGQHPVESGLCLAPRATVMNGYLQCAGSASFQDLQLLQQEQQEQQGREPSLLRAAHLLTVTNGSRSLPRAGAQGKLCGSLQMAASQGRQALSGHWEEKAKGCPASPVPLDGAHACTRAHTLALCFYSWTVSVPHVARLLPSLSFFAKEPLRRDSFCPPCPTASLRTYGCAAHPAGTQAGVSNTPHRTHTASSHLGELGNVTGRP